MKFENLGLHLNIFENLSNRFFLQNLNQNEKTLVSIGSKNFRICDILILGLIVFLQIFGGALAHVGVWDGDPAPYGNYGPNGKYVALLLFHLLQYVLNCSRTRLNTKYRGRSIHAFLCRGPYPSGNNRNTWNTQSLGCFSWEFLF